MQDLTVRAFREDNTCFGQSKRWRKSCTYTVYTLAILRKYEDLFFRIFTLFKKSDEVSCIVNCVPLYLTLRSKHHERALDLRRAYRMENILAPLGMRIIVISSAHQPYYMKMPTKISIPIWSENTKWTNNRFHWGNLYLSRK